MANQPVVSILMATHNRAHLLKETIQYIQRQIEFGFTHEHIIVDNASTDETEFVVRELAAADPRIKYFRNGENLFASGALNIAFANSSGNLIVPFDDDDILPELSLQMRFDAMRDPKVMWTSGLGKRVTGDRALYLEDNYSYYQRILEYLDENYEIKDPAGFFQSFFQGWTICGGTVTIRRECVDAVGGWDPTFPVSQDTEMWIKLASKHYHYKFINSLLFFYRQHGKQISTHQDRSKKHAEANQKLRIKYGIE